MSFAEIFNVVLWLDAAIVLLLIILDNRPPEVAVSWFLIILIFPVGGLILYALIGINWKKSKLIRQNPEDLFSHNLENILANQKHFFREMNAESEEDNDQVKLMNLLLNANNSIMTLKNSCEIYDSGQKFFNSLLEDIKKASHSIHMEFYIWTSDALGEELKEVLIQKAKEGVEVRLIFDGIGSFRRISFKYRRELRKAGIKYHYFLDLAAPLSLLKINYCNHRKIAVIDGLTAYTGGMNVGLEYITGGDQFESWRDTQIRIKGESVNMFQAVFLVDWYNSGDRLLLDKEYLPEADPATPEMSVQIATSGADSKWASIQQMFFTMITNANKDIYIQTPYFIPDQSIMTALETAALSGVNVNILMTGVPDKRIPYWAAQTYFEPLLDAGVNIFQYKKGFLHSKTMVIDNSIASIGSCNIDMRGFHINFELNALIYDKNTAEKMTKAFYNDLKFSETITREHVKKTGIIKKFRNSLFRILAPIM